MSEDDLSVRSEPADGETVLELVRRYREELNVRFPRGFDLDGTGMAGTQDVTPPNGIVLVAYLGRRAVGTGAVRRLHDSVAEIKRMWMDPEAGPWDQVALVGGAQ